MLKWVGGTSSPFIGFGALFEAKTVIGTVKFHKVLGVLKQALVKTTDAPGAVKSGWVYWMQVSQAQGLGIDDGDIVAVTKGMKPLKPGEHNPDTGKPAPGPIKAAKAAAAPAPAAPAPAAPPAAPAPVAAKPPEKAPEAPKPEPVKAKEPEKPKEPEKAPPPPAAKEPEPAPAKKEPPQEPAKDKEPEVVPPSTNKETPKLKKKVPLGTVRFHSVKEGEPAKQAYIRATDDPNAKKGGWQYLMTSAEATKQGIHHDDVLSFSFTPNENNPMKGKIEIHKDENGHIKKISTAAQFPKPEAPKADEPKPAPAKAAEPEKKEPEPPKEEPKKAEPEKPVKAAEPEELPQKTKELIAYLKGLPSFVANPESFLHVKDGGESLFNTSLKTKFGDDWFEQWKKATGKGDKDTAAPPKAEPENGLLSHDELPVEMKKKLEAMGAGKNSLIAKVVAAMHSGGKQSLDQLSKLAKIDSSQVEVTLDHLMDHGYATKHPNGTYGLKMGWTSSPTPEAPGAKKEVTLPYATSNALKSKMDAHDIDYDSGVAKLVKIIDAHGTASAPELAKAAGLSDFEMDKASDWLLSKKILKYEKGAYSFDDGWTTSPLEPAGSTKKAAPEEPKSKKKAAEPEPEPEPEPAAKAPPKATAVGLLNLTPTEMPDAGDLKFVASGKEHGLGGAGEKHIYKDKKGHEWLFKIATAKDGSSEKPFAAYAQEGFAKTAQQVKSVHIPVKVMHIKGKLGTLQPLIPNSGDLKHAPSPSTLTPMEREDVASEHMLDWLHSQHDSFGANLMRTKTGRIVGVDKEQGFRYFGADKLSTDYKPNTEFHGEKPPYYNQFWDEWAEKKFDFDPTILKKYFDAVDAIDDEDFLKANKAYAESFWEDKPKKQEEFLNELRKRKQNLRSDFENFLTDLYKKRTGQAEGSFTFKAGWVPGTTAEPGKPKKVVHKYNAAAIAGDYNISTKAYVPLQGPDKGVPDPTKIAVKTGTGETGVEKLAKFAKEMKLTPYVPAYSKAHATKEGIIPGNQYNWAFFEKDKWDAASVEKTEEVGASVGNTPHEPEFKPDIEASPHAHSNLHELDGLQHVTIPALGKRLTLDGDVVEGQHARAKKFVDKKGDAYYLFQFKLRESTWKKIKTGDKASWAFSQAKWDPTQHAFVESAGASDVVPTKKWTNGNSEVHLATDNKKWSYMGSMYAKVRPAKGQTPAQALHALLEQVEPGLANKILTPPTTEEREVVKLSRVLWSIAPKENDGLPEDKRTVNELKKRLKKHGYDDQKLSTLQEIEAFPGYTTWSKPGRYKEIAKGKMRYLFNGISDDTAALSVMQYGLLGIHERNMLGLPAFGGSYGADVNSGSGDGILTRVVTDSGFGHNFQDHAFCGKFRALVVPSEVDRLDTYVHPSDKYGTCRADNPDWENRQSVEDRLDYQGKHYGAGLEMSFRKGIGKGKLLRMVCDDEPTRKALIKQAKQQGIMQVNGVPVDDFVVVCKNLGEAYEKYVKPMGY